MSSVICKNIIFTILQPGLVAGYIPYWLITHHHAIYSVGIWQNICGLIIALSGIVICLACIRQFAIEGKGTLSPLYPTKSIVITGLYKLSRNPMYLGVLLILIGESLYYLSLTLAIYATFIFALFYTFIILVEEPRLRKDFGEEYDKYKMKVRRWL